MPRPTKSERLRTGLGHVHFKSAPDDFIVHLENHWLGVKAPWGFRNHLTQCHRIVNVSSIHKTKHHSNEWEKLAAEQRCRKGKL